MFDCEDVDVIIVTYADRRRYLYPIVDYLVSIAVGRIVIVGNGIDWEFDDKYLLLDNICFYKFDLNVGPAIGYIKGFEMLGGYQSKRLIWLLDDDNLPQQDCLRLLLAHYAHLCHAGRSCFAVAPYRPVYMDVPHSLEPLRLVPLRSCFLGFHVAHLFLKKKLSRVTWDSKDDVYSLMSAPYGGLLFSPSLFSIIGYPREDYILYADDLEWSSRIFLKNGCINLVRDAVILDLDCSWDIDTRYRFYIWLEGLSDVKAYYRMRNCVHFFRYSYCENLFIFYVNMCIYLCAITIKAIAKKKIKRLFLLHKAVYDGIRQNLGLHPSYSL